jgi:hypothetical protein
MGLWPLSIIALKNYGIHLCIGAERCTATKLEVTWLELLEGASGIKELSNRVQSLLILDPIA